MSFLFSKKPSFKVILFDFWRKRKIIFEEIAFYTPMRVRNFARSALIYSVISIFFAADTIHAQFANPNPPPPVIMTDANGVDLKSGNFVSVSEAFGVGSIKDPAISFTPLDVNYNNNVGTPLIGWIQHYVCGLSDDGCTEYLVARLGNKTSTFHRNPGETDLRAFTGEHLVSDPNVGIIIYDNDDTAWFFSGWFGGSGNGSYVSEVGSLVKISYRDGRSLVYTKIPDGTTLIDSNQGYQLIVRPGQADVKLANTAIEYCDASAPNCGFSQSWPSFTRNVTSNGTTTTFTLTDPAARVTTISSTAILGAFGGTDSDIYRPGGLHQFVRQRGVILYNQGGQSASAMVVTNYSDDFGNALYGYTSDLSRLGSITHSTASRSDGSHSTYDRIYDANYLTDELGNSNEYLISSETMQPWSYGHTDTVLRSIKKPEQIIQTWDYDYRGNVTRYSEAPKPNMGQSTISSSTAFRPTCIDGKTCHVPDYTLDARGARTDYAYDPSSGMMTSKTSPPDANGIRQETRYSWQQLQAVYKQSPGGAAIASGDPIWKLSATSTCLTNAGAACVGTADEVRTTYSYNGNLLPVSETIQTGDGSLSSTTTRDYDAIGNVTWIDGPAPGSVDRTYYFWNLKREPIGEVGPDPDGAGPLPFPAIRREFDVEGRVTKVETGSATAQTLIGLNGMTVYVTDFTTYDKLGRKLTERRVGGSGQTLVQYSYGYKKLLECTAIRMNPAIYDALPSSACSLGQEGGSGPDRITKNIYDAAGRLIQVRKAVGTSLEQAYATYSYTPNGKREYVIDAAGTRAKQEYDGFDRQVKWIFPSATKPASFDQSNQATALSTAGGLNTGDYEQYGYDANGNRTSLRKRDGSTLVYTFDALNRVIVKAVPPRAGLSATNTRSVYYGYDVRGHQLYARFDSATGEGVTNVWDGLGRQTSSTLSMDGVSRTLTRQYDADGNRTAVIHPDTTLFGYSYDGLDRPVNLSLAGTSVFAQYVYNAQGGTSALNRGTAANTSYGYDGISRLSSLTQNLTGTSGDVAFAFSYNAASQVVSRSRSNDAYMFPNVDVARSYTVNGLNQYQTAGPATFTYDANGNLTSDGSVSLTYDVENRLISASGEKSATLRYDPLGRLYETSGGSAGVTRFLYDGDELVAEYDGSGNMLRRYIHGNGADDPVAWVEGPTTWRYLHSDHQGSVVAISDDAGNLLSRNSYDEWGIPAATNVGRFQYTGQAWIPELGMYYYKARIYSPTLGRFLQTDPVGYDDQINLYAYVANDPVNGVDPTGQRTEVNTTYAAGIPICMGGAGGGGCYEPRHMNIRITPDDQASIRNFDVFNRVDADGNRYATLSAGPDGVPEFSNLKSTINRAEGATLETFNVRVPSIYKSENQFINALFKADASYKDNVPYTLFPDSGSDGRNSNSYVTGILGAAGVDATSVGAKSGLDIPGANIPLRLPCQTPNGVCP